MADDDLKQFFSMLPKGSSATIIMDCCHSGSMLDGTQVAIDGAKDNNSITSNPESLSLLGLLGGIRDLNTITEPRSLSVNTIASILGGRLGHPVSPNSSGIGGALAETFGGDAGKLMGKFFLVLVLSISCTDINLFQLNLLYHNLRVEIKVVIVH